MSSLASLLSSTQWQVLARTLQLATTVLAVLVIALPARWAAITLAAAAALLSLGPLVFETGRVLRAHWIKQRAELAREARRAQQAADLDLTAALSDLVEKPRAHLREPSPTRKSRRASFSAQQGRSGTSPAFL